MNGNRLDRNAAVGSLVELGAGRIIGRRFQQVQRSAHRPLHSMNSPHESDRRVDFPPANTYTPHGHFRAGPPQQNGVTADVVG